MHADVAIAYISVGFCTLPSDFDRAMREASVGRAATDTDSYAFFVSTPDSQRGDDRGAEKKHEANYA